MEKKIFNITVSSESIGYRIDKFLQLYFKKLSRTRLQNLIREGQVRLNSELIRLSIL